MGSVFFDLPGRAYARKLAISDQKYKDLVALCDSKVIPECWRNEYYNLKHNSNVRDCLNDTDDEEVSVSS